MIIYLKHELGQDVYHQILGTAIGTKFAPHYVNIFMAGLEEEIFSSTVSNTFMATLFG